MSEPTADQVDMGEGAALDDSEPAPLFCGMPCLGSCEETCPYNNAEEAS